MTRLRAAFTIIALELTALGATGFATLWETGQVATWLKLGKVTPSSGPGDVDPAAWQPYWHDSWQVRFPGDPTTIEFKWKYAGDLPVGVRRIEPFEGYVFRDIATFDNPDHVHITALDSVAQAYKLGVAKSQKGWERDGIRFLERVYATPSGDLTARSALYQRQVCLLVAVGPHSTAFLDSLRSTLPPKPAPANIPGREGMDHRTP